MKQKIKDLLRIREHPEDPYYDEDEDNMSHRALLILLVITCAVLFLWGTVGSAVRSSSIAASERERKAERETAAETVPATYSPAEKESIQSEFNEAVKSEAGQAIETVLKSRTFSVAVKGVSRTADFARRVFRGDYIDGYTYEEDSYLIEVPLHFEAAKVLRVVDGDTLYVEVIGSNNPDSDLYALSSSELKSTFPYVRLLNINTEESVAGEEYLEKTGKGNTEFGKEASDYVKGLLKEGDIVYLSPDPGEFSDDKDKYGRYLRLVWNSVQAFDDLDVDDTERIRRCTLNADLVLRGYAETLFIGGNDTYRELFTGLQTEAMEAGAGMWRLIEKIIL